MDRRYRSKMGLRENGTMRRSGADRRLRGGLPVDRPPDLVSLTNRGRQSAKGYPWAGGVFDPSDSRNSRVDCRSLLPGKLGERAAQENRADHGSVIIGLHWLEP